MRSYSLPVSDVTREDYDQLVRHLLALLTENYRNATALATLTRETERNAKILNKQLELHHPAEYAAKKAEAIVCIATEDALTFGGGYYDYDAKKYNFPAGAVIGLRTAIKKTLEVYYAQGLQYNGQGTVDGALGLIYNGDRVLDTALFALT